jgi:thioredoxin-like negative regulator of GroEL
VGSSAPAKPKAVAAPETATTAAGDCGASLRRYQQIVDADPASAQAGEALLAMARCRTQRGERALARALLERAARNVHVASRAKALLSAPSAPAEGKSVSP